MRFSFTVLFFSLMMFVGTSFAQNDFYKNNNTSQESEIDSQGNQKKIISRVDNQWYIGSTPVEEDIIVNAIKSNPLSADDYSTAMMFYYPALTLAGIGGAGLGYGIVAWITQGSDSDEGMYITLGGAVSIGLAILLGHFSNNYYDSSIELYNMYIGDKPAFMVKLVPTEKGGLALAFAF